MNKAVRFTIVTLWIVFSRTYDVYCTHQLTPDLTKEANPLVSVLGLDWMPLLIVISLLCLYALFSYYVSVFQPRPLLPEQQGLSFREVSTYVYLGRTAPWISMLYQYPRDIQRLHQVMGHMLSRCLVFAGVVSTLMWILINYTSYYQHYHSAVIIYSILAVGCVVIIYQWYLSMYRQYLEKALPSD